MTALFRTFLQLFIVREGKYISWTHRSHAVLKVLHWKVERQDLEKVLNLTTLYIKYSKSMEIVKGNNITVSKQNRLW